MQRLSIIACLLVIGNVYSLTSNIIKQVVMLLPVEKILNVLSWELAHKGNMEFTILLTLKTFPWSTISQQEEANRHNECFISFIVVCIVAKQMQKDYKQIIPATKDTG